MLDRMRLNGVPMLSNRASKTSPSRALVSPLGSTFAARVLFSAVTKMSATAWAPPVRELMVSSSAAQV